MGVSDDGAALVMVVEGWSARRLTDFPIKRRWYRMMD